MLYLYLCFCHKLGQLLELTHLHMISHFQGKNMYIYRGL